MIFKWLKAAFVTMPMLHYFDLVQKICIKSNTLEFAVSAVISQLESGTGQWHPIVYWSRKITSAKRNYGMGKAEMLATIGACKQ